MTSPNKLEVRGNLHDHPFAELLTEAATSHLDGSFRLSNKDRKAIIYLRGGEVVFAVSNAREHRLFEIILRVGKLSKEQIAGIPNPANDLELGQSLLEKNLLNQIQIFKLSSQQVEEILKNVLTWTEGEWVFSPLARVKDSINHKIETRKFLLEYARELTPDKIVRRFRSFQETFGLKPIDSSQLILQPLEAFVLSRFENSFLKIQEIVALGGMSEAMVMKTLYTLWLGGYLYRQNFHNAFPEYKISAILSAKLAIKSDEQEIETDEPKIEKAEKAAPLSKPAEQLKQSVPEPKAEEKPAEPVVNQPDPAEERRRLEEYLTRVEEAVTLYEVLGVPPQAETPEIKTAYFALAKNYHPDLFHQQSRSEIHRRIQTAFTEIAHAYEILKDKKTREVYDFKNREKIDASKTEKTKAPAKAKENTTSFAEESFKEGYDLLMNDEYEEAMPLLARAVHLQPNNARYHAFYGKLLAYDESSRYKAESEFQQAIKLDAANPLYRLMLAEFYIDYNLYRRAEGELQRLLTAFPKHPEALALLESLWNK